MEGKWKESGRKVEGKWRESGWKVEGKWRESGGKVEGKWRESGGKVEGKWSTSEAHISRYGIAKKVQDGFVRAIAYGRPIGIAIGIAEISPFLRSPTAPTITTIYRSSNWYISSAVMLQRLLQRRSILRVVCCMRVIRFSHNATKHFNQSINVEC